MNISTKRILDLIKEKGYKAKHVEEATGLPNSSVYSWKNEKCNPSIKSIAKLAEFFDVSIDYLTGKTDERQNAKTPQIDNFYPVGDMVELPILGVVRAGCGGIVEQENIGTQFLPQCQTKGYPTQDLFVLLVKGDSMFPRIYEGDHALVHRQTSVDSGNLAVVLVDQEEAVIKKVYYGNDWIELVSFNQNYPPRKFCGADVQRVFVIGKVLSITQNWE